MKKASAIVVYTHFYNVSKPYILHDISLRALNMKRIYLMNDNDVKTFCSLYEMVQYVLKVAKSNGYYISLICDDFSSKLWDIDFVEIGEWFSKTCHVRDFI